MVGRERIISIRPEELDGDPCLKRNQELHGEAEAAFISLVVVCALAEMHARRKVKSVLPWDTSMAAGLYREFTRDQALKVRAPEIESAWKDVEEASRELFEG